MKIQLDLTYEEFMTLRDEITGRIQILEQIETGKEQAEHLKKTLAQLKSRSPST